MDDDNRAPDFPWAIVGIICLIISSLIEAFIK